MTRFVAILCYYTGIDRLFYWLNRRAKRIITFHNVLPDELFLRTTANGVSSRLSDFRFIIRELKRRWRFSVDLFDAKTVTITFDAGYRNQYEVAAKVLDEEGGIPAIVFIAGDVRSGEALVIDRVLHWVSHVPQEVRENLGYATAGELWGKRLWREFSADGATKAQALFERLNALYPYAKVLDSLDAEYRRLRLSGITENETDDLRRRGWLVGWHTKSHYPLSRLASAEKRAEIAPPTAELAAAPFSFPVRRTAERRCRVGGNRLK